MIILFIPEMNIIDVFNLNQHHVAFLSLKKVVGLRSDRNTIKHIPHVGLYLFTDVRPLALKVFTYSCKSYLRSTMAQTRLSRIATITIERSYANRIHQESMNRIIDIIEKRKKIVNLFFLKYLNLRCDLYIILLYCVKIGSVDLIKS